MAISRHAAYRRAALKRAINAFNDYHNDTWLQMTRAEYEMALILRDHEFSVAGRHTMRRDRTVWLMLMLRETYYEML